MNRVSPHSGGTSPRKWTKSGVYLDRFLTRELRNRRERLEGPEEGVPRLERRAWRGESRLTRWSTIISSEVKLSHAINLRALCGANVVTLRSNFRANETLELHRVDWCLQVESDLRNFIQTSVYDKYSGSIKITTHLDHISYCKTASGAN